MAEVEAAERSELSFWVNELPGDGGDADKRLIMSRICERIGAFILDPHQPKVRKGKPFHAPAAKPAQEPAQEAPETAAPVSTAPAPEPAQEAQTNANQGTPEPAPEPIPANYFKNLFSDLTAP
jgi:hypothetical protein